MSALRSAAGCGMSALLLLAAAMDQFRSAALATRVSASAVWGECPTETS